MAAQLGSYYTQEMSRAATLVWQHRIAEQLETMGRTLSRAGLTNALGTQFGGDRDIYQALGYNKEPDFEDFLSLYTRQDVAARIVDMPALDTWRKTPILSFDGARTTDDDPPDFFKEWNQLVRDKKIWHQLKELDRLSGIGRYGVMLIGVKGDSDLKAEISKEVITPDEITYTRIFTEGKAKIVEYEKDPGNPRFGKVKMYGLELGQPQIVHCHPSRIIHAADNRVDDEVLGYSRLLKVMNRLMDLEKVVGGSSEAVWLSAFKGIAFLLREGYSFPKDGSAESSTLTDEIEDYIHNFSRRYMKLKGVDVQELESDYINPKGMFDVLLAIIAGATGIPQRMLTGSERGELASTQDENNWIRDIETRQKSYAEPEIFDQFLKWIRKYKVVQLPEGVDVIWPNIYQLTEVQKSEIAFNYGRAIQSITTAYPELLVPLPIIAEKYFDYGPNEIKAYKRTYGSLEPGPEPPSEREIAAVLPAGKEKVTETVGGKDGNRTSATPR